MVTILGAIPMKCVNRGRQHSCRSRNSSVYKKNVAIKEVRILNKRSYFDAKKRIWPLHNSKISYAQAVKLK